MDLELAGRVVLVTGGTDGLGLALAERLVAEGARVAVCGRNEERVERARTRWSQDGAIAMRADVTQPADVEAFVAAAAERWGRIDGVVNNAGKAAAGPIADVTDEVWQADLDLKVLAAVRLTRLALPLLRTSPGGAVVNVLNASAKTPRAASLPSTASRAAGMAITKALSQELGGDGIRVNAILIGQIESGQWRRRADAAGRPVEDVYAQLASTIPLGRVGRAEEFADLAAFLLSPRAGFVNGANIPLDGGQNPAL